MNAFGSTVGLNDLAGLLGDDKGTFWEPIQDNFLTSVAALGILVVLAGVSARIALALRVRG
jgi:hypothetical protein